MRDLSTTWPALILLATALGACADEPIKPLEPSAREVTPQLALSGPGTEQVPGDRKDTPWQRMTDVELAQAVGIAGGRVMIGFKDPGAAEGVDNSGRVLASGASSRDAKQMLRSAGGEIVYEFKRMPAVVATISPELVATLRASPYVDYVEPTSQGTWATQVTPWGVTKVGAPS